MTNLQPPYSVKLHLTGPDTVTLLERIVTCRVDDLIKGEQRPGALLTPQGKIIADFWLKRMEDGCVLHVHSDAAPDLAKRLKMFRLRADVAIKLQNGGAPEVDHQSRIDKGLPVFGEDFGGSDVFPTDINLDIRGGIDYKKGCFVGQEVVSRMKRRGKIRKRSVTLLGNRLQKGQSIKAGDKRLGQVTSATDRAALAILRIDYLAEALETGAALTSDDCPVTAQLPDWLISEMEALKANVKT